MPANNRFSDNPFRDPNLTPEQVERIEARNKALRIFRETGDKGPAIEAGIFPAKPTNRIAATFARTFKNWDIKLPAEAVNNKQAGKLSQAGWNIEYLFGVDGDSEYLDYYATHRMTNDSHVRSHADGKSESLEAPQEMYAYPGDADEAARQKAKEEFQARNRAIYQKLREKGFLSRD